MNTKDLAVTISKIRDAHQGDIGSFLFGKSHELAWALWFSSERRGRLYAGFRQKLGWRDAVTLENYSYMVYQSLDGQYWDIHGSGAIDRWEDRWLRSGKSNVIPHLRFRWEEVDPKKIKEWVERQNGQKFYSDSCDELMSMMNLNNFVSAS